MNAGVWIIVVIIIIVVIAVVAWIVYRYFHRDVNGNGTNGNGTNGGGGTTIPDLFGREYDAFLVKLGIVKRKLGEIAGINTNFPASCRTALREFILDIPEIGTSFDRVEAEGTKPVSEIFQNKTDDLLKATDFFDLGVRNTTNDLENGLPNINPIGSCQRYIVSSNLEPAWGDFVKDVNAMSADVVRLRELSNL